MTPPPPLLEETRRCAQPPALITSGRPRVEEKVLTIVGDRFQKAAEKNPKSIGKIIMGGQLLKLGLLLLSVTYSSSMDPMTSIAPEMATDSAETLPSPSMDSPLAALKDGPPTNKTSTFADPSAKELMTAGGSIKESKGVPEQETSTAPEATQEETSTNRADAVTIRSNTSGPLVAALNVNTPSDNGTTFIGTTTREPVMPSTSTPKESTTTPEQEAQTPEKILGEETTTTAKATMTIDSTTSKDPSSGTVSTGPELITVPTGLTFTSQDNTTNDDETTSSSIQPSGGPGTSKPLSTPGPNNNNQPPKNPRKLPDKDKRKITIVVVVLIVLLFLVLVTVVVVLVRKRRRSGSQSFHRNSSKDVWAGQVPQLGEGKVAQHPMGVANGAAGNKAEPGQEQEMITFISAEKKEDSSVEVNEMGKGDTSEKKPLLEETSQEKEKPPVQEQTPE